MAESRFVYVTYIRTTVEKLWQALIDPEFTRKYWLESWQESTWNTNASWDIKVPGGQTIFSGQILEIEPERKLVLTWRNEKTPEIHAEGYARLSYELETIGDSVKLTVLHEMAKPESLLIKQILGGWPFVLASLKSLLETGESIEATRQWKQCG